MNSTMLKSKINESATKKMKLTKLFSFFEFEESTSVKGSFEVKQRRHKFKSLSDLAFAVVSKMKKSELNIVYSEYLWPQEFEKWKKDRPKISFDQRNLMELESVMPDYWFYYPNQSSSRDQLEVSCVDSTHLLTRMRRKCCRGGIEGLSNTPWRKVAKSGNTSLSLAMIDAVIEPMSVTVAVSHFGADVEKIMRENGDIKAAELCKDIRNWWHAEDSPGISAKERLELRKPLRSRLLSYANFDQFPPHTMYVNGWPLQLWEAVIANIDAKIILYGLSQTHSYNVRSFSSMMGETFFAELTMFDRRGRGTVTATEFGQYISSTCESLNMRMDPHRLKLLKSVLFVSESNTVKLL